MRTRKRDRIKAIIMEQLALLTLEIVVVIALSLTAIFTFYQISSLLLENKIMVFDEQAYQFVKSFASPFWDQFMKWVTFLGNRQFIVFAGLGLMSYYLFIKPHRWYSIKIPAVALGSISANLLLKELYDRARPAMHQMIEASGLSFPSGHAMFNLSFYGLLIYIIWRETINKAFKRCMAIILGLLILLIGISRIYLGVHYTSDVLAGFCAGFLWLVIALFITNKIEKQVKKKTKKIVTEKAEG